MEWDAIFTSEITSEIPSNQTRTSLEDPLELLALLEDPLAGQAWVLVGDDSGNRTCPKIGSAAPSVSCRLLGENFNLCPPTYPNVG